MTVKRNYATNSRIIAENIRHLMIKISNNNNNNDTNFDNDTYNDN